MTPETQRVPGTSGDSPVPRRPFGGARRLVNAVDVRFGRALTATTFDAGPLQPAPGTVVVCDTDKGPMLGRTTGWVERRVVNDKNTPRLIRVARDDDNARAARLAEEADKIHRAAVRTLRRVDIPVKIVSVELPLDESRVFIFYAAERRVDVRSYVRALAREVRGRIDMRHIGLRDGAGVIGGIGPCGNEVCCSSFLSSFASISIRFAKDQGLSLTPSRITGMCGRLKCCLVYEQGAYKEMRKLAPRKGHGAITSHGAGNIIDVDVLARKIRVRLPHNVVSVHVRDAIVFDRPLSFDEIDKENKRSKEEAVLEARRQRRGGTSDQRAGLSRQAASVLQEDYIWDETAADVGIDESIEAVSDKPKRSRRRRKKPTGSAGGQQARGGQRRSGDSGEKSESGDKKPRRRRRRGDKGKAGGGESSGAGSTQSNAAKPDAPRSTSGAQGAAATGDAPKKRRRRRRRGKGGTGGPGTSGAGGGGGESGSSGGGAPPAAG